MVLTISFPCLSALLCSLRDDEKADENKCEVRRAKSATQTESTTTNSNKFQWHRVCRKRLHVLLVKLVQRTKEFLIIFLAHEQLRHFLQLLHSPKGFHIQAENIFKKKNRQEFTFLVLRREDGKLFWIPLLLSNLIFSHFGALSDTREIRSEIKEKISSFGSFASQKKLSEFLNFIFAFSSSQKYSWTIFTTNLIILTSTS